MTLQVEGLTDATAKGAMTKQIDAWKATVARYESDPKEKDGRRELMAQAKQYEADRDTAMARYHNYEFGSAAFQIGIVLASAEVITGIAALGWLSGLLGFSGLGFMALGLWAPHALHLG